VVVLLSPARFPFFELYYFILLTIYSLIIFDTTHTSKVSIGSTFHCFIPVEAVLVGAGPGAQIPPTVVPDIAIVGKRLRFLLCEKPQTSVQIQDSLRSCFDCDLVVTSDHQSLLLSLTKSGPFHLMILSCSVLCEAEYLALASTSVCPALLLLNKCELARSQQLASLNLPFIRKPLQHKLLLKAALDAIQGAGLQSIERRKRDESKVAEGGHSSLREDMDHCSQVTFS
jgi:hypothetical protein